ncbi:MAG: hypothetical protein MUP58_02540 [Candidatus Nanohaloarchaeota archaeon QJJ-9]|nr:hypothetical protein [Candidatus Nanohaloarchaeota archaeon QJJ-9]
MVEDKKVEKAKKEIDEALEEAESGGADVSYGKKSTEDLSEISEMLLGHNLLIVLLLIVGAFAVLSLSTMFNIYLFHLPLKSTLLGLAGVIAISLASYHWENSLVSVLMVASAVYGGWNTIQLLLENELMSLGMGASVLAVAGSLYYIGANFAQFKGSMKGITFHLHEEGEWRLVLFALVLAVVSKMPLSGLPYADIVNLGSSFVLAVLGPISIVYHIKEGHYRTTVARARQVGGAARQAAQKAPSTRQPPASKKQQPREQSIPQNQPSEQPRQQNNYQDQNMRGFSNTMESSPQDRYNELSEELAAEYNEVRQIYTDATAYFSREEFDKSESSINKAKRKIDELESLVDDMQKLARSADLQGSDWPGKVENLVSNIEEQERVIREAKEANNG